MRDILAISILLYPDIAQTRDFALTTRPRGMTKFYPRDPHGNLPMFGIRTDELPDGHSFPEN